MTSKDLRVSKELKGWAKRRQVEARDREDVHEMKKRLVVLRSGIKEGRNDVEIKWGGKRK